MSAKMERHESYKRSKIDKRNMKKVRCCEYRLPILEVTVAPSACVSMRQHVSGIHNLYVYHRSAWQYLRALCVFALGCASVEINHITARSVLPAWSCLSAFKHLGRNTRRAAGSSAQ
jgi:hypothetical protein